MTEKEEGREKQMAFHPQNRSNITVCAGLRQNQMRGLHTVALLKKKRSERNTPPQRLHTLITEKYKHAIT